MKKIILSSMFLALSFNVYGYAKSDKVVQEQSNNLVISTKEAKKAFNKHTHVFIDVREKDEYDSGHIKGINLIPLSEVDSKSLNLDKTKKYITVCRSGMRSKAAAEKMKKLGLNVVSMSGGMNEWAEKGYPVNK